MMLESYLYMQLTNWTAQKSKSMITLTLKSPLEKKDPKNMSGKKLKVILVKAASAQSLEEIPALMTEHAIAIKKAGKAQALAKKQAAIQDATRSSTASESEASASPKSPEPKQVKYPYSSPHSPNDQVTRVASLDKPKKVTPPSPVTRHWRYKALADGVIRSGAEMDSSKVGKLVEGEIISVSEQRRVNDGTLIFCK